MTLDITAEKIKRIDDLEKLMRKPNQEKRKSLAKEISDSNPRTKTFDEYFEQAKEIIRKCFDPLIEVYGYRNQRISIKIIEVDLNNRKNYRNELGECLFVQFTNDGYIVVVGAGHDYGLTENDRYLNVKIIKNLKKEWSTKAILLFVTGIKQVVNRRGAGVSGCDHVLQCRNGVEMYLGECLLKEGFPILNEYSHKNYMSFSSDEWTRTVNEIFQNYKIDSK